MGEALVYPQDADYSKDRGVEAVILALDPAKHTSGATILIPDYGNALLDEPLHPFEGDYVLAEYGKVESQSERERFVEALLGYMEELELPPVVVAEEWDPPRMKTTPQGVIMDPKWTYKTILGVGEGWGRWTAELETASAYLVEEFQLPPLPVVRVTPNVWRDVFPSPRPKDTTALKQTAIRYFEGVFGIRASEDISEAGCIGLWGTTAEVVTTEVAAWLAAKPKPKSRNQRKKARRSRAS